MSNPMWVAGGKSPNPEGSRLRKKHSARTVKGMVERFVKKNITPNKLQKMYDKLTANQQLEMLLQLVPYVIAKVQPDSMSKEEMNIIFDKIQSKIDEAANSKKAV
jgi:hypothetical protein